MAKFNKQLIDQIGTDPTIKDILLINDKETDVVYSQAYTLYEQNKFDQALNIFKLLCLLDSTNPKFWSGLAASQKMLCQYENAIKSYAIMRIIDPDNAESSIQASHCYLKRKEKEKAKKCLDDAAELIKMYPKKNNCFATYINQINTLCR